MGEAGFFSTGAQVFESTRCPAVSHCPADSPDHPSALYLDYLQYGPWLAIHDPAHPSFLKSQDSIRTSCILPHGLASVMRSEHVHSNEMEQPRSYKGHAGPMLSPNAAPAGKSCSPDMDQRK